MKLQYITLAVAASLSTVVAQSGLPSCATSCATGSMPSECNQIDIECICSKRSFITDMSCCVATECEPEEQDAALEFAKQICGGAGVTDLPSSATCAGGSSATTTKSGAETTATTPSSTGTESPASSSTPTETPASTPGGAAIVQGKEIGLLAAIAAAVAFLV